jgi:hypothetical protein
MRKAPAPFGIATGAQCLIVTVHRLRSARHGSRSGEAGGVQRSGLGKNIRTMFEICLRYYTGSSISTCSGPES